jgi:hypothetical protein
VPQQHLQILRKPRIGAVHDQVRADRGGRLAARVGVTLQLCFDIAEPAVELFGAAAIHRRERTDHAVAAGGDDEIDAGDKEHWSSDQRQAEAILKACEEVDRVQEFFLARVSDSLC